MQPELLLLDEVTSALDPELVAEVLDVIRELAARRHDDGDRDARDGLRARHREPRLLPRRGRDPRGGPARADLQRAARGADAAVPAADRRRRAPLEPRSGVRCACWRIRRASTSSLEPLDEYIVIQPVSDETETRAGLILPASAPPRWPCRTGIVTAVGSEPNGIEPGDKVLFPKDAGFDVRLGGIEVKVLRRSELIARIHD